MFLAVLYYYFVFLFLVKFLQSFFLVFVIMIMSTWNVLACDSIELVKCGRCCLFYYYFYIFFNHDIHSVKSRKILITNKGNKYINKLHKQI